MKNKVVGIDTIEEKVVRLTNTMATLRNKLEACHEDAKDLAVLREFAEYIYNRREQFELGLYAESLLRKGLHKEQ